VAVEPALREAVADLARAWDEHGREHDAILARQAAWNTRTEELNAQTRALAARGRALAPHLPEGAVEAATNGVAGGIRVGALGTAWVGVALQGLFGIGPVYFAFAQPEPPAAPVPVEYPCTDHNGSQFAEHRYAPETRRTFRGHSARVWVCLRCGAERPGGYFGEPDDLEVA
jgi:hypothetical protein